MAHHTINVSPTYHALFLNHKSAPFWLLVRLYVGYAWLMAGWEKVMDPAWFGLSAGAGMSGFIQGAIAKTAGAHPAVQGWYAAFLQSVVQPNLVVWANAISLGELAVGLGLIVGLFVGTAAFFGAFMNLNFLLAGTTSTNPILLTLSLGLILARRVAGRTGLDRYARSRLSHRLSH
jgi:thiosulfate dehydrogenase [quinone] large subunit